MSHAERNQLDAVLAKEINHPCSYHPAGRNSLFLNPLERAEIIRRIEKWGGTLEKLSPGVYTTD